MDFLKDNNPKILEYVKETISVPEYVSIDGINKNANVKIWADNLNKEYPIDTPENIWLSYAYIKTANEKHSCYQEIVDTLELAAAANNIYHDVKQIDRELNQFEKHAHAQEYALSIDDEGVITNYYPLNDVYEIEKSARALADDMHKMPIEFFHDACKEVVKAAKQKNVDTDYIPRKVYKHGVETEIDFKYAAIVADQRKDYVDDEEVKELYTEIVKWASKDPENIREYIDLFSKLDRSYNIKYSNVTPDPFSAFYSGSESEEINKIASTHVVIDSTVIPFEDIKDFDTSMFDIYCSEESSNKYKEIYEKSASTFDFTKNVSLLDEQEQSEMLMILATKT